MKRLVITDAEKITIGELKAFLSNFDDEMQIVLPDKCKQIDISPVGRLDTMEQHLMIAPRD